MTTTLRRAATAAAILATPIVGLSSASATPPGEDGNHTVTICHVTNSPTNPFVVITVDVAAFDGDGANDHTHHESHDGRVDQLAVDGECGDITPTPEPDPTPDPTPEP